MKPELDRVKNDLETMQKAIGLTPPAREWSQWLRRDNWLNLAWVVPGLMLIGASLAPLDETTKFFGLAAPQWVGLAVAAVLLVMLVSWAKVTRSNARPVAVRREYKRINIQASWFLAGFIAQIALYFAWGHQYAIGGQAFTAGLWILSGSSVLLMAMMTKWWVHLGWALPMIAFGLCQPLLHGAAQGMWLGLTFIAGAMLCSIIQGWQSRVMEQQHVAD